MNCKSIAEQVYGLAKADQAEEPLAPLVKEALEVIDHCLDTHGWVSIKPRRLNDLFIYSKMEDKATFLSASTEAKIVSGQFRWGFQSKTL